MAGLELCSQPACLSIGCGPADISPSILRCICGQWIPAPAGCTSQTTFTCKDCCAQICAERQASAISEREAVD